MADWAVILISTFLFWVIHVLQYKGVSLALVGVFINGLLFALLFYVTGSIIPSILTHAVYNVGIGIYFMKAK
ncbi:CPBP family intramembrane metalloprotease [Alkalihalobacillus clausii]|nr:CPBP family intramembrane metalloprotease [Shouchella clausii]